MEAGRGHCGESVLAGDESEGIRGCYGIPRPDVSGFGEMPVVLMGWVIFEDFGDGRELEKESLEWGCWEGSLSGGFGGGKGKTRGSGWMVRFNRDVRELVCPIECVDIL